MDHRRPGSRRQLHDVQHIEDRASDLRREADEAAAALEGAAAAVAQARAAAQSHGCELSEGELADGAALRERVANLQTLQVWLHVVPVCQLRRA